MNRTRRVPTWPAAAGLALALMAGPAVLFAQTKTHYTISGDEVAVFNLIGEARVVRGTGPDVEVDITFGGDDAGELKVETGEIKGRETLRVVYPGDRFVYPEMGRGSRSEMSVHDDGTFGGNWLKGHRVRISGGGSGTEAWADLVIKVPDRRDCEVHVGVGEVNASGVTATLFLDTSASPVTAEDITGDLKIDVGSGSVSVTNIRGNLDIDTGSGHVDMMKVSGDRLLVDTGSGHVTGQEIKSADIDIDTGSGHIDIAAVETRRARLDTGSGGVDLGLLSDVEDVSIDTGSGGVRIEVPEMLGAEVVVKTGSGGIDVDVPHESYRHKRDYFSGRFGDGNGRINVETGSGGVRFREI